MRPEPRCSRGASSTVPTRFGGLRRARARTDLGRLRGDVRLGLVRRPAHRCRDRGPDAPPPCDQGDRCREGQERRDRRGDPRPSPAHEPAARGPDRAAGGPGAAPARPDAQLAGPDPVPAPVPGPRDLRGRGSPGAGHRPLREEGPRAARDSGPAADHRIPARRPPATRRRPRPGDHRGRPGDRRDVPGTTTGCAGFSRSRASGS